MANAGCPRLGYFGGKLHGINYRASLSWRISVFLTLTSDVCGFDEDTDNVLSLCHVARETWYHISTITWVSANFDSSNLMPNHLF